MVAKLPGYEAKAMFVTVLVEGSSPSVPPTSKQVDLWIEGLKVPFTVGRDVDDAAPFTSRAALGPKETAYIVERATGIIVAKGDNELALLPKLDTL